MTGGMLASSPVMLILFLDSAGSKMVTCVLQKGYEKEQIPVATAHQVAFRVTIKTQEVGELGFSR